MEEPKFKRPKLYPSPNDPNNNWSRYQKNLELLQTKLLDGCLCNSEVIELKKPISNKTINYERLKPPQDYTLQFINTIGLLNDVATSQQATIGFVCTKILDMANSVAGDFGIWDLLLECLDSKDKFISFASSKCILSILFWAKTPNMNDIFNELFNSILPTLSAQPNLLKVNPLKMCHTLDIIRNVIEYRDDDLFPIANGNPTISNLHITDDNQDTHQSEQQRQQNEREREQNELSLLLKCAKIEVDSDLDVDVRNICIKALENWWTRVTGRFKTFLTTATYDSQYESSIISFLTLWEYIVSVKSNLSVIDTKHFYLDVESFVVLLNSSLPPLIWRKLLDVFNQILCYGNTLSLQEEIPEEPCFLAHSIIRNIKSRQFLQNIPYSKRFSSFGGSNYGPIDWEKWQGEIQNQSTSTFSTTKFVNYPISGYFNQQQRQQQPCSSSKSTNSHKSSMNMSMSMSKNIQTFYIGPDDEAITLEECYDDEEKHGDKPLLQKVVLLVLKSVALCVKETGGDSDESSNGTASDESASESDLNDLIIIERSIKEVFKRLDDYVKSIMPFHPETSLATWFVKLLDDQDDVLIEAMLCTLDIFNGFYGKIQISPEFLRMLNPAITFVGFANAISEDKDTMLDLLMNNETCFLLYLLNFLKYVWKHYDHFKESCENDFEKMMTLLIRLKITLDRLVEKALFPFNINPLLRLMEKIEEIYENENSGNGNTYSENNVSNAISDSNIVLPVSHS